MVVFKIIVLYSLNNGPYKKVFSAQADCFYSFCKFYIQSCIHSILFCNNMFRFIVREHNNSLGSVCFGIKETGLSFNNIVSFEGIDTALFCSYYYEASFIRSERYLSFAHNYPIGCFEKVSLLFIVHKYKGLNLRACQEQCETTQRARPHVFETIHGVARVLEFNSSASPEFIISVNKKNLRRC